jgi:Putative prokaryotic signal transducing protein
MVTLRAYSNPAEAALAKSLLDDHNILCSLADENAQLYGGAPFAMPVRIVVADEQAEEADHVLKNADGHFVDFDPAPDSGVQETIETLSQERLPGREQQLSQQSPAENNPWEILAIASLLLLPGLGLLLRKHELILVAWGGRRISRTSLTVFSPATAHVFGALVIAVALLLTILFFYTRRAIMREQTAAALLRDQKM